MKIRFTLDAAEQANQIDSWWRENRTGAQDLFARELADAKTLISMSPKIGILYAVIDDEPVRKVFLPRTRHHVYYKHDAREVVVLAVWGAPRGHGPHL
jgi:plasmid stabilization system protein ParE